MKGLVCFTKKLELQRVGSGESYLCFRKVILQTVGKGVGAVRDRNQMAIERTIAFLYETHETHGWF